MPKLWHYISKTWAEGGRTGVSRFDHELSKILPIVSTSSVPDHLQEGDLVITDNHMCMDIPAHIPCVSVHHGCAATHYALDEEWRKPSSQIMVMLQQDMLSRPNTYFVSPSKWVRRQFWDNSSVIWHWVEREEMYLRGYGPTVVIGDWRDNNKGKNVIPLLNDPRFAFRPLNFTDAAEKYRQYAAGDIYLCLSLSEGCSYSMADAEAWGMPIVTTKVGSCYDYPDLKIIQDREPETILEALSTVQRTKPSFFINYDKKAWRDKWISLISRICQEKRLSLDSLVASETPFSVSQR